jgi:uncharacterized membrane protein YfcA
VLATIRCRHFRRAFGLSVPIGALAGLIGLGGGEFRLPVLMHVIGFGARAAVPINLVISLLTLAFALATRSHAVPLGGIAPHWPEMLGLLAGGMASAAWGARLVQRLSDARLVRTIAVLLGALGLLLLAEAAFPLARGNWLPDGIALRLALGVLIGLGVGLVSSVLGVAGGELLIPALMLVFGADIKTAGSASILISLAVVATGLARHHAAGALAFRGGARRMIGAMSLGSLVGAALGGLAVAVAPAGMLKLLLGLALLAAAAKTMRSHRA